MQEDPLVSIVTPSYNSAAYLKETIESVLSQDYPRIEYIVVDGGSTDGTIEILERYKERLRYVSGPDSGAAEAINRGFEVSHGSIFAWLSADDTYLPGAVSTAVRSLTSDPNLAAVYGEAYWVGSQGEVLRRYPTQPFDPELLGQECYICQPACFLRRAAFQEVGMLDMKLQFAFDYDLWIRMSRRYRFGWLPEYLATSRMHGSTKTLGRRAQVFRETFRILKHHYGYVPFQWVYGYCCYLVDKRDQFYEPLRPSIFKYSLSLPHGCRYNWDQIGRYWREWCSVMSLVGLIRRWNESWIARALGLRLRR